MITSFIACCTLIALGFTAAVGLLVYFMDYVFYGKSAVKESTGQNLFCIILFMLLLTTLLFLGSLA